MLEFGDDLDGEALAPEYPCDFMLVRGSATDVDDIGLKTDETGHEETAWTALLALAAQGRGRLDGGCGFHFTAGSLGEQGVGGTARRRAGMPQPRIASPTGVRP